MEKSTQYTCDNFNDDEHYLDSRAISLEPTPKGFNRIQMLRFHCALFHPEKINGGHLKPRTLSLAVGKYERASLISRKLMFATRCVPFHIIK